MSRRQGAREAAEVQGLHARPQSRTHAEKGDGREEQGLKARPSRAHAHTRRTPAPPEACASLASCPLALSAWLVSPKAQVSVPTLPALRGSRVTKARDPEVARLPEEMSASSTFHQA